MSGILLETGTPSGVPTLRSLCRPRRATLSFSHVNCQGLASNKYLFFCTLQTEPMAAGQNRVYGCRRRVLLGILRPRGPGRQSVQAFPQYGRNARSCYDPTALVSNASGSPHVEPLFPYDEWHDNVDRLAAEYLRNEPFPHIHLEGFLKPAVARRVLEEFPDPTSPAWREYKHFNENKLGMTRRDLFPSAVGALIDEFNSPQFVLWLSKLTCIPGLMADPSLEGGGMHQSTRNGFLNIHADFTMHHHHRDYI